MIEALLTWEPMARLRERVRREAGSSHPVWLARAPGRLDVMGGIADYSGAVVCEMPLRQAAGAAVQPRDDHQIICHSAQQDEPVIVPTAIAGASQPEALAQTLTGASQWARYVAGCVWWLADRGHVPRGCEIWIDSDVPLGSGISSSAAIEVAVMQALCQWRGVTLSPMQIAAACQVVENRVVGAPCGVMDQVASMMGRGDQLLEIHCQPDAQGMPAHVLGMLHVPQGFAFIGMHSGVTHEVSGQPYTDTRVAAFMGQKILSMLRPDDLTRGYLSNIPAVLYRSHLRAQLPDTMTGQAFIDAHGSTYDPVTRIEPARVYHIQAAVDHHVLEMDRVGRFIRLIRDQAHTHPADDIRMIQAGQLMLESHHSYGDHARLGHPLTDRLVALAMNMGAGSGIFGARITGGGCGGTIALLIREADHTADVLALLRSLYERETGRKTMLFDQSGPGAAELGVIRLERQDV